MMPEQKGRSGKKPKYQIPDIGGAEMTAGDISTEKVLNFLIKGEAPPPGQTESPGGAVAEVGGSAIPPDSPQTVQNQPHSAAPPDPEPTHKKSLARLFERASGGGNLGKELPLQLPEDERREELSQLTAHQTPVQPASDAERVAPHPQVVVESPVEEVEPVNTDTEKFAQTSPELAQYVELWKNYYRLKAGEVEALSVMYRLSHGQGRSDCYLKMHNLAEMSHLTYRYCQKVVRTLEQLGWITKLKDYDPADQLGVLYRVNLKPLSPLP